MSKKVIAGLTIGFALLSAAPAFAQTTTDATTTGGTSVDTTTSIPGTPNTGAGGSAAGNAIVLVLSGLLAAGGATYLLRNKLARA